MTREGNSGRCTRCGAEGVNRRSCTGDADTHAELAKGYTGPNLGSGNGSGPTRYPKEYEDEELPDDCDLEEVVEEVHGFTKDGRSAVDFTADQSPHDASNELIAGLDLDDLDHTPDIPFEVAYTPPEPARPGVFIVSLRVITRMPAGTEAALVDFIHDIADVIYLDTDFEELRYE